MCGVGLCVVLCHEGVCECVCWARVCVCVFLGAHVSCLGVVRACCVGVQVCVGTYGHTRVTWRTSGNMLGCM